MAGVGIVGEAIHGVSFATLDAATIRRLSVRRITHPVAFTDLDAPTAGGLYDARLGPMQQGDRCITCGLGGAHCPGHLGHIDLPVPLFHPLYFKTVHSLLRAMCRVCHRFRAPDVSVALVRQRLRLVDLGLLVAAEELDTDDALRYFGPSDDDAEHDAAAAEAANELSDDNNSNEDEDADADGDDEVHVSGARRGPTAAALARKSHITSMVAAIEAYADDAIRRAGLDPATARPRYTAHHIHTDKSRREYVQQFIAQCLANTRNCPHCAAPARRLRIDRNSLFLADPLSTLIQRNLDPKKWELAMIPERVKDFIVSTNGRLRDRPAAAAVVEERGVLSDTDESDNEGGDERNNGNDSAMEDSDDEGVAPDVAAARKKALVASHERVPPSEKISISPVQAREHLRRFWDNELPVIRLLYSSLLPHNGSHTKETSFNVFFLDVLAVPPNRFRPASMMNGVTFENPQTAMLAAVLKECVLLGDIQRSEMGPDDGNVELYERQRLARLNRVWQTLQERVNVFMDSSMGTSASARATPGIRQLLERKEGLFRMHMMGKRVNFAARSVISPDPMIGTNEVGVPDCFATKLTYPQPVTPHNVDMLYRCVLNGPDKYPGAVSIEDEFGRVIHLSARSDERRLEQAKSLLVPASDVKASRPKIVHRHVQNGDWVLMNRQPTLHKSSIMAHQIRVLTGERTMRLHYANCKSYNADFDGDEMNMHVPQSEAARAEAMVIASNNQQYIGLAGEPLRGLIQDHLIAATRMCCRDTFYDRDHYQALVYSAFRDDCSGRRILTVPPCMLKPRRLWSGKQIITTVLKNLVHQMDGRSDAHGLNLISKAKIKNSWSAPEAGLDGEGTVIVRNGELLCGVLDKSQCGATPFGLVHSCYEVYGGIMAGNLLSALGRLFTHWLKYHAHTLCIDDLILSTQADKGRRKLIRDGKHDGRNAAATYVRQEDATDATLLAANMEKILRDDNEGKGLDAAMSGAGTRLTSAIISATMPSGLIKPFPHNNFQLIVLSGAKGSTVNATQISCLLGQQTLEGRRVPVMVSGKTLPSFRPFDASLRAGGMITDRFLTGLRPQEYFFHCMAGREGLVDTAVKTSRSGYLQRCLIKHLEDLRVHYDLTVRDADGSIVQFRYGEDSLDVTKVLQLENFDFLATNYRSLLGRYNANALARAYPGKLATRAKKHMQRAMASPAEHEPILNSLRPDTYFGCVSERFFRVMKDYSLTHADTTLSQVVSGAQLDPASFETLMYLMSRRALADPGEPVGIIAAQAIGEPSTQMTLNTFHFAGRGDVNVTLGIPRLREIVMTASSESKTPVMTAPILPGAANLARAHNLALRLAPVYLGNVLQRVTVKQSLVRVTEGVERRFCVRLEFIPPAEYGKKYGLTAKALLRVVERSFLPDLLKGAQKQMDKDRQYMPSGDGVALNDSEDPLAAARGTGPAAPEPESEQEEVDSDADEEAGDGAGTVMENAKKRHADGGTYEGDEEPLLSDSDLSDGGGAAAAATTPKNSAQHAQQQQKKKSYTKKAGQRSSETVVSSGSSASGASAAERYADEDSELSATVSDDAVSVADSDDGSEGGAAAADDSTDDIVVNTGKTVEDVVASVFAARSYTFEKNGRWLELTYGLDVDQPPILFVSYVERVAEKVVIRSTKGIHGCAVIESDEEGKPHRLQVEGLNLSELWRHGRYLDLNKLDCNDVQAHFDKYGVEAGRDAIIKEVRAVFAVYGIEVNFRHLSLVADYMSFEGTYRGMNRISMRSNVSPFMRMSFESTTDFLRASALTGDHDHLASSSSCLVVGKVTNGGTGLCGLMQPLVTERAGSA